MFSQAEHLLARHGYGLQWFQAVVHDCPGVWTALRNW